MSVRVFYEILNQRGTPAMFTDTLANRPAFGFAGRLFVSTDSGQIFEDTGSAWTLVADAGVGGGTLSSVCLNGNTTATGIVITAGGLSTNSLTDTALTAGSILYAGSGGLISQSNSTFFWDATNNRLGIGINAPGAPLDIHATGTNAQFNGTGTNNAYLQFQNAGVSKWRIGNTYNGATNNFDIYNNNLGTTLLSIDSTTNFISIVSPKVTLSGNQTIETGLFLGYAASANISAHTQISAQSNGLQIQLSNSTGGGIFQFQTAASYTYTFPAATGTLALTSNLSSYVPYTGATGSVDIGFNNLSIGQNLNINGPNGSQGGFLAFKQFTSGAVIGQSNYTSIYTYSTNLLGFNFFQSGSTYKTITFDCSSVTGGTTRNLIFPDASGTLALTSNLSSYLPLTGGTLTGQLYINPTNTGVTGLDVASDNISFRSDNLEGNKRQLLITMGSGTLIKFQAQGYGANYGTDLAFYTATTGGANSTPAIYITGTNNRVGIKTGTPSYDLDVTGTFGVSSTSYFANSVGIGTSSPNDLLEVRGGFLRISATTSNSPQLNLYSNNQTNNNLTLAQGFANGSDNIGYLYNRANADFVFGTNNSERMRITSGGYTKISNSGTYEYVSAAIHEIRQTAADYILYATNPNASPNGHYISYTTASPNGTSNPFLVCSDSTATRFTMRSNGGLANYQANNVNLSDERTKKDIIPLESYWDKFKAIEIVKFKYKDQTHDDYNIGVIAQQVESIAPEFVDVDGWDSGKPKIDGEEEVVATEEPLKSIYTADLYHATIKVLQEAMAKIEELNERLNKAGL